MLRWFKKHFIPHEDNDHQPYFLRDKNIRFLLVIMFVIEFGVLLLPFIPALNPSSYNFTASVLPSVLDDLTNQNRQSQHLATLTVSPLLNKVAELKAKDMAEKGYFAHISPDGKSPWYWFEQVGYDYEYAGENLAVDFTDSQDIVLAWMNSPTHMANIVKNTYTEVGTGIAAGTYHGNPTIFVAQVYGKPARVVAEPVEEPTDGLVSELVGKPTSEPVKVAIEDEQLLDVTPEVSETVVLGVESVPEATQIPAQTYVKTNILQRFSTSPRHAANIIFVAIGALVGLALLLKLFIRMDKRHPILITNGLVVLAIVFGVYAVNSYVAKTNTSFTTSFAIFHNAQFEYR